MAADPLATLVARIMLETFPFLTLLIARILYAPIYAAGLPWVRTLIWLAGFIATALLDWLGLGVAVTPA